MGFTNQKPIEISFILCHNPIMKENNKNIFPLVLIIAVILILVGGAYWYSQQIKNVEEDKPSEPTGVRIIDAPESTEEEDMEEDEEEIVEVEETEEVEEIEELTEEEAQIVIANLFAEKYSTNASEAIVAIDEIREDFISGGISFEGEMGGGYIFIALVDGEWEIVADGNGTIPCEPTDAVDYPVDMIPECWDEDTQTLITRE